MDLNLPEGSVLHPSAPYNQSETPEIESYSVCYDEGMTTHYLPAPNTYAGARVAAVMWQRTYPQRSIIILAEFTDGNTAYAAELGHDGDDVYFEYETPKPEWSAE